jgi:two-component system, NarL family, invasion response regulator UvrY
MVKIIIADHHPVVRQGIKEIISHESDIIIVGEAKNSDEILKCVPILKPDLVILDISLPGKGGLDILDSIRTISPDMPVLIFSYYPENKFALRFLNAGAAGYLNKDAEPKDIILAIRTVLKGSKYISPALAEILYWKTADNYKHSSLHDLLSKREFEIFRMLLEDYSISDIAKIVSLSIKTISTYKSRIFTKLKIKNLEELKEYAKINNLIYV